MESAAQVRGIIVQILLIFLLDGCLNCDTEFGAKHFWMDANAHIILQQSQSGLAAGETTGAEDSGKLASELLKELVCKHRVTFNPNISKEGVHGAIDAHDLALVTACVTLHSSQQCCDTFHQQFGLIRDPNTDGNNWKIKFTNATLVSKEAVSETPQLTTTNLLALNNSSSTASSAASSSPPSRESPSNPMAFS